MKTYEPRRNNACPNGLHPDYDPQKDPSQNECTCPWLIIQSSTPVQHLTSWNRRETENFIREVDRGYFDPPGYPKRTGSMFLSPAMQRLLDVAEKEPVAAALTLLAGSGSGLPPFDAVAWDAEDACLSVRVPGLGWRRLWLGHANVEAVTDSDFTTAGGANPVLLWADHPDTWTEIGGTGAMYQASGDVYAEDLVDFDSNGELPGGTPIFAMAKEANDIAADSTTARIMGDYMPLILTVPADEIPNMKPGHPIYDQAAAALQEMTETEKQLHANPELVEQIQHTIDDPSSRVRRERPLPRRVPQVPSDIAQAGAALVTRGGGQFPTDVPEDVFRAAQADACTCEPDAQQVCDGCQGPGGPDACGSEDHGVKCAKTDGHKGPHENSGHDQAWFELDPR